MKVLIAGCGAVGQVFGLALQNAGVELGLYDQPNVNEKLRQALSEGGLPLYRVRRRGRDPILEHLSNYQVVPDLADARRFRPDQAWVTVPSPAYYTDWFRDFLEQVPAGRVVCFIPEGKRPEFLRTSDGDRLVFAGTTFMAWQGVSDGGGAGGVSFWRPPMAIPLSGETGACREVGALLRSAGFRYTIGKRDSHQQASATALITAFVAGLEFSGWSLSAFRRGPWLSRAAGVSSEAVLSQLPEAGWLTRALLGVPFLSASLFTAAFFMPFLFPFDLEKYLKFHYQKTRVQTLALLRMYAEDGKKRGLPVENIQAFLLALGAENNTILR